jgi:hypothetical protein
MDSTPISLQLMDTSCKPVHAREYMACTSVKQKLRKEIARLVACRYWSP